MKRILELIFFAAVALTIEAQVSAPNPYSRVAGRFVASNYGAWSIPIYSFPSGTGSKTFSVKTATAVMPDGRTIMPFNTNAQIVVGVETVTLTAVGSSCVQGAIPIGACTLTATFSYAHTNADKVSSGTFGLQEALNDASASGGGTVVVDSSWIGLGGTTTILNAATLPTSTGIENELVGPPTANTATNILNGSAGAQPYQTAASTTAFVYPATDANALNLDGNRTDSYTPDGTPERPYKTLDQLATGLANVTGPYVIACNPTTAQYTYTGNVTFPAYQGTIIGNSCLWNITGNVTVPGTYYISNLYTYITGSLSYTSTASYEKVRIGGSLVVSGGITTSGYDHFFDMSILSNTVINVAASSTPVFTNVVGTPLIKTASGSTASTVVTIIDSQSLATGAYTNVDLSNGGLLIARGYLATNNNTVANIILSGSSGSSTSVANELSGVGAAWVTAGSSYTYLDNSSLIALLTGTNLLTPSGLGIQAPAANTVTVKSGTTGAATFDSGTTGAVNVGTGANAKTVSIGSTVSGSKVNIAGEIDGVVAGSGFVGQVVKGCLTQSGGTALTSASTINLITLNNLSAGDWDVEADANLVVTSLTATNGNFAGSITTTSATLNTDGSEVHAATVGMSGYTGYNSVVLPRQVVNISTPTNVYLVVNFQGTISSGSGTLWGCMTARRVH